MQKDKMEYQLEASAIAEGILINRGIVEDVLSLQYKDDTWLITSEIDTEQMKRSNRMGDPRLWLKSIAISHSGYLVFNMGTRALVHNALIKTEDVWARSPETINWLNDLELLRTKIYKEDTKYKLTKLNSLLMSINDGIRRLEDKEV
jgi:hypothetical protein